jgi:hypothetical protein
MSAHHIHTKGMPVFKSPTACDTCGVFHRMDGAKVCASCDEISREAGAQFQRHDQETHRAH